MDSTRRAPVRGAQALHPFDADLDTLIPGIGGIGPKPPVSDQILGGSDGNPSSAPEIGYPWIVPGLDLSCAHSTVDTVPIVALFLLRLWKVRSEATFRPRPTPRIIGVPGSRPRGPPPNM